MILIVDTGMDNPNEGPYIGEWIDGLAGTIDIEEFWGWRLEFRSDLYSYMGDYK